MNDLPSHLIRRAAQGDHHAFRRIVEQHSNALFRLAYRMTQNEAAAEDIVQDTFIKAYRKLAAFNQQSSLRTWLHRIAANTALDYLRRNKRYHPEPIPDYETDPAIAGEASPLCAGEQQEIQQRTGQLLQQLSPLERAALCLRHFEGYSIREICNALGINENPCKQAIFRAVKKLRMALEPWS